MINSDKRLELKFHQENSAILSKVKLLLDIYLLSYIYQYIINYYAVLSRNGPNNNFIQFLFIGMKKVYFNHDLNKIYLSTSTANRDFNII